MNSWVTLHFLTTVDSEILTFIQTQFKKYNLDHSPFTRPIDPPGKKQANYKHLTSSLYLKEILASAKALILRYV